MQPLLLPLLCSAWTARTDPKDIVLGIDLGTTHSVASYYDAQSDSIKFIPTNVPGSDLVPSAAYIVSGSDDRVVVGSKAYDDQEHNPTSTFLGTKRYLDSRVGSTEVSSQFSYKLGPCDGSFCDYDEQEKMCAVVGAKKVPLEVISALILKQIKHLAELHLRKEITKAVVTVPAYFHLGQREATLEAARLAGLEVDHLLQEPVAAALAYAMEQKDEISGQYRIFVFDFGGGTLDICVMMLEGDTFTSEVVHGDSLLGGDDIDRLVADDLLQKFKQRHGLPSNWDPGAEGKTHLRSVARRMKEGLTDNQFFTARLSIEVSGSNKRHTVEYTRREFQDICAPIFQKVKSVIEEAMSKGKLEGNQISKVLLVGGSSRIPRVQAIVRRTLGVPRNKIKQDMNMDKAISEGAAWFSKLDSSDEAPDVVGGILDFFKTGSTTEGSRKHKDFVFQTPYALGVAVQPSGCKPSSGARKGEVSDFEMLVQDNDGLLANEDGELSVSLRWFDMSDLDVKVITPSGETISYKSKKGSCGGMLDVDANYPSRDATRSPVENIRWVNTSETPKLKAPPGTYEIYVQLYSKHPEGNDDVPYELMIKLGKETEKLIEGRAKIKNDWVLVHSVHVPDPGQVEDHGEGCALENQVIIPALEHVPASNITKVRTSEDNQAFATIIVLEGDKKLASDNPKIGEMKITGLTQKKAKELVIEIKFEYDENNILHVTAMEEGGGNVGASKQSFDVVKAQGGTLGNAQCKKDWVDKAMPKNIIEEDDEF